MNYNQNDIKTVFSEEQIQQRVNEISVEIEETYQSKPVLTLLVVMKGAFLFASDLIKKLNLNVRIEFIEVSSYGERGTLSGQLSLRKEPDLDFANQHILIIEDIIDTGQTAEFLQKYLEEKHPASIEWCLLLQKHEEPEGVKPKFVGFRAPDKFLIGYGLDYKERYRNLPFIGYLESL